MPIGNLWYNNVSRAGDCYHGKVSLLYSQMLIEGSMVDHMGPLVERIRDFIMVSMKIILDKGAEA